MSANVGNIDRIVRALLGLALILAPFLTSAAIWGDPLYRYGAIIVGAVLLLTSAMRFCPAYRLLGIRTCRA